MSFKDYYAILEIDRQATAEEIRDAYRKQSKRWHPDLNPGQDVTRMMQDINEAYALLKDATKKARYDYEYNTYYCASQQPQEASSRRDNPHEEDPYTVHDEALREDIKDAQKYAENLVAEFFKSLKETSKIAAKGAWDEAKYYLLTGIIMSVIATMMLTCAP